MTDSVFGSFLLAELNVKTVKENQEQIESLRISFDKCLKKFFRSAKRSVGQHELMRIIGFSESEDNYSEVPPL